MQKIPFGANKIVKNVRSKKASGYELRTWDIMKELPFPFIDVSFPRMGNFKASHT